ncbi:MAG: response regulator [Deltaproteobacteria bacterium]|nr:MAG: response regulator [Deltaproteobacteria bacterium]
MSEKPAVLVVDDERNVLRSLSRLLRTLNVDVVTAETGEEAIGLVSQREFSLIISDHLMPGMKGVDLLSRAREIQPETTRILLTGHADLEVALEAINRGEVFRFLVKPWDDDELLAAVTEGIHRYEIVRASRAGDEAKLLSLAQTIELKDPYTRGHCERVAAYSLLIADVLQYGADRKKALTYGAWLHDCGKIGIPEQILNAERRLTEQEMEVVKKHPLWGAEVARQASLPEATVNIILYHHEHYDGTGYPSGLKGEEIPEEARIVAIADVFDAITTERPYQKGMSLEEGCEFLKRLSGTILDPVMVEIFLSRFEERERSASCV